jgi:formylglycine-generating enzyme required for sulfatase activity
MCPCHLDTSASFNIATNPVVGVFIYRDSNASSSTFTVNNASLWWNYSQDGVATNDTIDIRVFAIEMVYIPQGNFFAGDNAASSASLKQGSSDNDPWYIGSEAAFSVGNQAGAGTGIGETNSEFYYVSQGNSGEAATGSAFTIPAEFPKGYKAFYMMKGELSQGQWVTFFNTLTSTQKATRDITATKGDNLLVRNNISWTSGDATLPDRGGGSTYEAVSMNYLSWGDVTAYLDWAGLRPMTELEYERAGRGPYRAVTSEYAWGSTSITQATTITDGGKFNEVAQSAANCVYGNHASVSGPMRVGAMSTVKATRIESGAGYYGNMDLSGNLYEQCVTIGNATGCAFNGAKHGNGALTASGNGDVSTWPGTNAIGAGFRGGAWNHASANARLSGRFYAATTYALRSTNQGGRGGRAAP